MLPIGPISGGITALNSLGKMMKGKSKKAKESVSQDIRAAGSFIGNHPYASAALGAAGLGLGGYGLYSSGLRYLPKGHIGTVGKKLGVTPGFYLKKGTTFYDRASKWADKKGAGWLKEATGLDEWARNQGKRADYQSRGGMQVDRERNQTQRNEAIFQGKLKNLREEQDLEKAYLDNLLAQKRASLTQQDPTTPPNTPTPPQPVQTQLPNVDLTLRRRQDRETPVTFSKNVGNLPFTDQRIQTYHPKTDSNEMVRVEKAPIEMSSPEWQGEIQNIRGTGPANPDDRRWIGVWKNQQGGISTVPRDTLKPEELEREALENRLPGFNFLGFQTENDVNRMDGNGYYKNATPQEWNTYMSRPYNSTLLTSVPFDTNDLANYSQTSPRYESAMSHFLNPPTNLAIGGRVERTPSFGRWDNFMGGIPPKAGVEANHPTLRSLSKALEIGGQVPRYLFGFGGDKSKKSAPVATGMDAAQAASSTRGAGSANFNIDKWGQNHPFGSQFYQPNVTGNSGVPIMSGNNNQGMMTQGYAFGPQSNAFGRMWFNTSRNDQWQNTAWPIISSLGKLGISAFNPYLVPAYSAMKSLVHRDPLGMAMAYPNIAPAIRTVKEQGFGGLGLTSLDAIRNNASREWNSWKIPGLVRRTTGNPYTDYGNLFRTGMLINSILR